MSHSETFAPMGGWGYANTPRRAVTGPRACDVNAERQDRADAVRAAAEAVVAPAAGAGVVAHEAMGPLHYVDPAVMEAAQMAAAGAEAELAEA